MARFAFLLSVALALSTAACSDPTAGPDPSSGPLLQARVSAVGGGSLEGLWAVWREDGTTVDSVALEPDGSFGLRASAPETHGELLIDGPMPRAFHPLLFPLRTDSLEGLELLLVPLSWPIRAGTYRGETVSTRLDPAVEDNAARYLYTYFFGQAHPRDAPERFLLELMTWPADHLPARVAIDHEGSEADLTPEDSAALWGVLDAMEEATGLDLFRAVPADPSWWSDPGGPAGEPYEAGVIRVVHKPGRWRGLPQPGEPDRIREGELGGWAPTGRFSAYRERHVRLDGGLLLIDERKPVRLADGIVAWETVVTHEVLHVLGLGHTCRIPSPMGPCARTEGVSEFDVAYMELLREALRLARELDAPHGLMPSIVGERRVLLGLPALPTVDG